MFCGHPFIQFHHIVPWAEDKHYRHEDMMAVCASCHHLCTTGAIDEVDQRNAKQRPKNVVDKLSRGKLYVNSKEFCVLFAGGKLVNVPHIMVVDQQPQLSAWPDQNTGRLLISAIIRGRSGKPIAIISENEWQFSPINVWDFDAKPQFASIRQAARDIRFAVDARGEEVKIRGKWNIREKECIFDENMGRIGSISVAGCNFSNCLQAFSL